MGTTVISNARLVDGTGAPPAPDRCLVVAGDRIAEIGGPELLDDPRWASPDARIDAGGRTVMPGLIDTHVHISFGESRSQEEQDLYTSHELRTLRSAWNTEQVLRSGVTSISNPGGSYYIGVGIREAVQEGLVRGPRIKTAGRFIVTSNGLGDYYPDAVGAPDSSVAVVTNTVPEIISEVRRQIKNGVDFIKLADSPLGTYQAFTREEMSTVADLAHQLGKTVTIHARGSSETDAALSAGIDWIMHSNMMNDDVLEKFGASDTPLVPTLLLLANNADYGHLVGVPPKRRDGFRRLLELSAETYHRARAAGVAFATGTDTGFSLTPFGEWHARELQLLVDYAGLSPLEAIQAATSTAARVLGMQDEVGTLKPGYKADLLVVNGDPVADVSILQDRARLDAIMLDGEILEFPEQPAARHPFDRVLMQATGDLTYELVQGADGKRPEPAWRPDEAKDLLADLRRREQRAALD
jgi:imidazolonepropionase-like amidohydrolase